MSITETPLRIGKVSLIVHDLAATAAFYEAVIGLHPLGSDGSSARLGVGDTVLLELVQDTAARRRAPSEAGLFHTAFLLPDRGDLGRWAKRAMAERAPVVGASDHRVSEAIYLADPEGNGIEIYADRPRQEWRWQDGQVAMATAALDVAGLIDSGGEGTWQGAPAGTTVGHVHLQVGSLAPAETFYAGLLGLDVTCRYPGGTFFAAGGYHHHIATNIWNSRGAAVRTPSTGLSDIEILAAPDTLAAIAERAGQPAGTRLTLHDPWGTPLSLVG